MDSTSTAKPANPRKKDWSGYPEIVTRTFEFLPGFVEPVSCRIEWFKENAESASDFLLGEIETSECKVLSLDVFDTVLLRNDKPEAERYMELSESIAKALGRTTVETPPNCLDLLTARIEGMRFAYRTAPLIGHAREGHIKDVFGYMEDALDAKSEIGGILHKVELDYECENLVPNEAIGQLVAKAKEAGLQVVLLSDMYLPAEMIGELLDRLMPDVPKFTDLLISSCEAGHSKRGGSAFENLAERLDVELNEIFHIGDSFVSDFQMPLAAGCKAKYLPVSRPEYARREKRLISVIEELEHRGMSDFAWAKL